MGESANPFAPPRAEVADVQADGQVALAGRGTRFGAAMIDLVLQLLALWLAGLALGITIFSTDPSPMALVVAQLTSLALFLLLHGVLLVRHGQTIGKKALGIRIVRPDGSRPSPLRVLGGRYGVGFVLSSVPVIGPLFGLVDALLIFRSNRRCLHDVIADTIVVRA